MFLCCTGPAMDRPGLSKLRARFRRGKGRVNTRRKFKSKVAYEDEDNEGNEEEQRPDYVDQDPEAMARLRVREIMDACEENGQKFFDQSFYFDKQENLFPPGTPDDCTVGLPQKCMRMSELFGEDCQVFVEGETDEINDPVDASDIVQGSIGDCFLIGAISGIAAHGLKVSAQWDKEDAGEVPDNAPSVEHEEPIERLLVAYDVKAGVYGVMFFKMGQWEWVIIDDLIPMSPDEEETPLFANCKDMELWPMILEKAYAKLHHNWDAIDGGFAGQAVKDMTGRVMQMLDLYGNDSKYRWKSFLRQAQDTLTVIGCACGDHVEEEEGEGQCGEAKGVYGLIKGHAYTVLSAYGDGGGPCIVKVRNPWGNDAEWTGDWSDDSEPRLIVRFFPGSWRVMTHYGEASGNERDNTYIVHVSQSSDPPAKAVFVLGQSDTRCAHSILEDAASEEAHQIQKGQSSWDGTVSERMKLEVAYLGTNQPPKRMGKLKQMRKPLVNGSADSGEAQEVVWVEQRNLKVGYYMEIEEGIQYYLRVHFNPEGELSSWHLPKGRESALGYSQFEVEEEYDEEAEEEELDDDGEWESDDYEWAGPKMFCPPSRRPNDWHWKRKCELGQYRKVVRSSLVALNHDQN
eukprot:s215_g26.t1